MSIKSMLLVVFAVFMLAGCYGTKYLSNEIAYASDLDREFAAPTVYSREIAARESGGAKYYGRGWGGIARGAKVGIDVIDGREYVKYSFPQVLSGKDRLFNVLIPTSQHLNAIVSDEFSGRELSGGMISPKYWWAQLNEYPFMALSPELMNEDEYMLIIESVQPWGKLLAQIRENGVAKYNIVYLTYSEYLQRSEVKLIKRGDPLGVSPSELKNGSLHADSVVSWVERGRIKHGVLHGLYIFTIPFDIVTFPIQAMVAMKKISLLR